MKTQPRRVQRGARFLNDLRVVARPMRHSSRHTPLQWYCWNTCTSSWPTTDNQARGRQEHAYVTNDTIRTTKERARKKKTEACGASVWRTSMSHTLIGSPSLSSNVTSAGLQPSLGSPLVQLQPNHSPPVRYSSTDCNPMRCTTFKVGESTRFLYWETS